MADAILFYEWGVGFCVSPIPLTIIGKMNYDTTRKSSARTRAGR